MEALFSDLYTVFCILLVCVFFFAFVRFLLQKPEEEKLRYEKLRIGVFSLPHECGDITWKVKDQRHHRPIRKNVAYKHRALQKLVKTRVEKTPINTTIRITNFAWDILQDLEFCNLLAADWEPVLALHHVNGICLVRYMKIPPKEGPPDTSYKDLYFSTEDGHVVYWKPSS